MLILNVDKTIAVSWSSYLNTSNVDIKLIKRYHVLLEHEHLNTSNVDIKHGLQGYCQTVDLFKYI